MGEALGHRVTVLADERRYDLVAPAHARVGDLLSALGIAPTNSPYAVSTPGGRVLGMRDILGETVTEGVVLTVVRATTHEVVRGVVNLDRSAQGAGARSPQGQGGRYVPPSEATVARRELDQPTRRRSELLTDLPEGASSDLAPDSAVPATRAERLALRTTTAPTPAGVPTSPAVLRFAGAGLAGCCAVVLGLGALRDHSGTALWTAVPTAALLLVTGLALALQPGTDTPARVSRLSAPLLGFGAGLALPVAASPSSGRVAFVAGCAVGTALAGTARLSAGRRDGPARVAMTALALLGALGVAGILLGWPSFAVAAVAAGCAPIAVRLLPGLGLEVPDEQLVDVERLSTTVWSVREVRTQRRRRVRLEEIATQFRHARDIVAAGTVWAAAVAPLATSVVLLTPGRSGVARWGALALCVLLALAMGYQSRSLRDRLPRYALLTSATVLVLEAVVALREVSGTGTVLVVIAALVVTGIVVVAGSVALGQGWHSTRLSRLADALEGVAVVLSLPAAIVAADGIEAFRRMTAG
ncbi:hypothetical protein ABEG17_01195 [Pedococcus sp. KACC 23699]|uniref:EccD-like transmembrane domain-containing protein n=1 Tax=Pedococcus sp. KACC 23699 TaxID=3149228 RepID=A0AAU7JVT0_9MICO